MVTFGVKGAHAQPAQPLLAVSNGRLGMCFQRGHQECSALDKVLSFHLDPPPPHFSLSTNGKKKVHLLIFESRGTS